MKNREEPPWEILKLNTYQGWNKAKRPVSLVNQNEEIMLGTQEIP